MSTGAVFYIKPARGECVETTVRTEDTDAAALTGTVVSGAAGAPLEGAVALLFRCGDTETLEASAVTDRSGRFCFGPLEPGKTYMVRVFKNSVKLRELEIVTE